MKADREAAPPTGGVTGMAASAAVRDTLALDDDVARLRGQLVNNGGPPAAFDECVPSTTPFRIPQGCELSSV